MPDSGRPWTKPSSGVLNKAFRSLDLRLAHAAVGGERIGHEYKHEWEYGVDQTRGVAGMALIYPGLLGVFDEVSVRTVDDVTTRDEQHRGPFNPPSGSEASCSTPEAIQVFALGWR